VSQLAAAILHAASGSPLLDDEKSDSIFGNLPAMRARWQTGRSARIALYWTVMPPVMPSQS
jgi:hypothetical protein